MSVGRNGIAAAPTSMINVILPGMALSAVGIKLRQQQHRPGQHDRGNQSAETLAMRRACRYKAFTRAEADVKAADSETSLPAYRSA